MDFLYFENSKAFKEFVNKMYNFPKSIPKNDFRVRGISSSMMKANHERLHMENIPHNCAETIRLIDEIESDEQAVFWFPVWDTPLYLSKN